MSSIAALMADAIAKIKTVTALGGKVGAAAGAKAQDPTMRNAKNPCAWVIYAGDNSRSTQNSTQSTPVVHEIQVKVIQDYKTEKEMLEVTFPTLQSVIQAMTGSTIASMPGQCLRWSYMGQSLEEVDERLVYVQRYSVQGNV